MRLILLTPFVDYGVFAPVKNGAQDAARALSVQVTFSGTKDGDVHSLAAMVRQAVVDGYEGIALNIVDSLALQGSIAEAVSVGVPVIAFNVDDRRTPNARLAAIGQNMLVAGEIFGRRISSEIPPDSRILITMHDPNIPALEDRARGIRKVLTDRYIHWELLYTGTDREQATERVRIALEANSSIRIVIGTGSADTEAAGLAVERHFSGENYLIAGFDVSPEILRLIKLGLVRFTIDQQTYSQGYFAVCLLTLYNRYGLLPADIDTGARVIDRDEAPSIIELNRKGYR